MCKYYDHNLENNRNCEHNFANNGQGKIRNSRKHITYVGRFWSTIDFKNLKKKFVIVLQYRENTLKAIGKFCQGLRKLHYIKITYSKYHVTAACRKVEVFTCQHISYRGRGSGS